MSPTHTNQLNLLPATIDNTGSLDARLSFNLLLTIAIGLKASVQYMYWRNAYAVRPQKGLAHFPVALACIYTFRKIFLRYLAIIFGGNGL